MAESRRKSMAEMNAKEQKFTEDMSSIQGKLDAKEADLLAASNNLSKAREEFGAKLHGYELQIKELSVKLDHANMKAEAHDDIKNTSQTHIKES